MASKLKFEPILHRIPAERQAAKRHYGVHPYFTRRPANVVRAYIEQFTRPGDSVLDPFGGSGVTAIEAMLLNRHGIHNDINPLANFIASQVADTTHDDTGYIRRGLLEVQDRCKAEVTAIPSLDDAEVQARLASQFLPDNIALPKNSDAEKFLDLFTARQLLALALLKRAVDQVADSSSHGALLLAWSATLGKLNKTFLSARGRLESRGGSSIFSIYRYKVADQVVELPAWTVFRERVMNVIAGKEEVLKRKRLWTRTEGWRGAFDAHCLDIADLPRTLGQKVDYIFTDPPYGGHIAYLDLSILWNHWLGFNVPTSVRENEIIVGGELRLTEDHYIERLKESVRVCLGMLKRNRWFSIVFQHWNVRYFEAILNEATEGGASLKAAVTQIGDTIWSMHKKKNKEKVLAGELILSFVNDGEGVLPHVRSSVRPTIDELVQETLAEISPNRSPFAGELLFNRVILNAWKRGALGSLDVSREEFSEVLQRKGWHYDTFRHRWLNAPEFVQPGFQLTF
ncbi:MAG TPA: DNA methyltransferase [Terriglobia bacterium]|nr:DNA methyltransferase [Terriglobia bacterium]